MNKNIQIEIENQNIKLDLLYLIQATNQLKSFLKKNKLSEIFINVELDKLSGMVMEQFPLYYLLYCHSEENNEINDYPEIDDLKIAKILSSKQITHIKFTAKSDLVQIVYPQIALKNKFKNNNKKTNTIL